MLKWLRLGRCHAIECREVAWHETLIGVRLCRRHFGAFYSEDECPQLHPGLGEKLPAEGAAYLRAIRDRALQVTDPQWWAHVPRDIRWWCWRRWHHLWWPIAWHAPSLLGRCIGRHRCGHCDRFIVRTLDVRGIWICDECRDRHYSKSGAIFGGDAGRNQCCAVCQAPGESEIYGTVYCYAHGHEAFTGEPYVPPTEAEIRAHRALFQAMMTLDDMNQGPPTQVTERGSFSRLDEPYLRRLFKLTEKFEKELEKPQ